MNTMPLHQLKVGIKGDGELASDLAWRLYQANICKIFMMEIEGPLAVKREVSFCETLYAGKKMVKGMEAVKTEDESGIYAAWQKHQITVIADPGWRLNNQIKPDILIDATLSDKARAVAGGVLEAVLRKFNKPSAQGDTQ